MSLSGITDEIASVGGFQEISQLAIPNHQENRGWRGDFSSLCQERNSRRPSLKFNELIRVMDTAKRQRLEAAGWSIGDASDFLELSPEEATYIELKLALSKRLKQLRLSKQLSQQALAQRIKSSQSRVAKMEAGDPSVSLDLLVRALLSTGATTQELAEAIALGN